MSEVGFLFDRGDSLVTIGWHAGRRHAGFAQPLARWPQGIYFDRLAGLWNCIGESFISPPTEIASNSRFYCSVINLN